MKPIGLNAKNVKTICRRLYPGTRTVEAGIRRGTVCTTTWRDDIDDLEDFASLEDALAEFRNSVRLVDGCDFELDLYCYGRNPDWDEVELLGNVGLRFIGGLGTFNLEATADGSNYRSVLEVTR